jgi:hypothetical protein
MLYYVLIPVLVGMWPLLVWGVYLPRAEQARDGEGKLCIDGQAKVSGILDIDRHRLDVDKNLVPAEFSYLAAVDRVASLCRIPSSGYSCQAGGIMASGGKKRQDAMVALKTVSISQAATFLSKMQTLYPSRLMCENLKLQKLKKGGPDQWDVDFNFIYYY